MTKGKIAANITGVSRLIIVKATNVRKNCDIVILKLNKSDISAVSISLEKRLSILPIGVVSNFKIRLY